MTLHPQDTGQGWPLRNQCEAAAVSCLSGRPQQVNRSQFKAARDGGAARDVCTAELLPALPGPRPGK